MYTDNTGMPFPSLPASPYSYPTTHSSASSGSGTAAPSVHPLLCASGVPVLLYNVLSHPDTAQLTHSALYARSDFSAPATNPPAAALRVCVLSYPAGPASQDVHAFPWDATLAPPHRTSAPPAPGQLGAPLSLRDVLRSVCSAMNAPVGEQELAQSTLLQQAMRAGERKGTEGPSCCAHSCGFLVRVHAVYWVL